MLTTRARDLHHRRVVQDRATGRAIDFVDSEDGEDGEEDEEDHRPRGREKPPLAVTALDHGTM
ncbi:hypothetical protein [Rhodococcoides kroppenstedtii]|uniref:hypothetical protein n=1 Tax=Rhodococcoides kroppenstedtii TaxID=293050 RepID=UPI0011145478|nr:hypothetical protein [Rhodococcus kroppenstedtii]